MHAVRKLFLCGDLMPARGVDQVLPFPLKRAALREACCSEALDYVRLAQRKASSEGARVERERDETQKIKTPRRSFDDVAGALRDAIRTREPIDLRLANLESALTSSDAFWPGKEVCYRASPENGAGLLNFLGVDAVTLANNHAMDFGVAGLLDTLDALCAANVRVAGAGRDAKEAFAPVTARVSMRYGEYDETAIVFGLCLENSGVPRAWRAGEKKPGVALVASEADLGVALEAIKEASSERKRNEKKKRIFSESTRETDTDTTERRPIPLLVVSIHAGSNWGYEIERVTKTVARACVDAGADLVQGHSSHHARGAELYKKKLILYGCGEMLNDYEGIGDHPSFPSRAFCGDLRLAYFPEVSASTGAFERMEIETFTQSNVFRLTRADAAETARAAAALAPRYACGDLRLTVKGRSTLVVEPNVAECDQR